MYTLDYGTQFSKGTTKPFLNDIYKFEIFKTIIVTPYNSHCYKNLDDIIYLRSNGLLDSRRVIIYKKYDATDYVCCLVFIATTQRNSHASMHSAFRCLFRYFEYSFHPSLFDVDFLFRVVDSSTLL